MAQVILGGVGRAVAGPLGGMVGGLLGRMIDDRAIASLGPARQRGPRLEALQLQGTAEGAPLACVLGRARVAGQMIWAARFRESRTTRSGGKGGPRTTEYGYSLSFAVALCEGEIDGIGRVWADGRSMDLAGVTMRVHRGGPDQAPDPLIEAVEGLAPAYRGTAYVVFEDLLLGPFGNRAPQLAFEVFRRPRGGEARLEDRLEGVCLIPGAGEFVLATTAVTRRQGLTRSLPENLHAGDGRADLIVSLDQLQAQCPNLKRVSLVVGWFGTDLRAAHCVVRPGVERRDKPTEPVEWSVAGLDRAGAHLISNAGGGPAYGGTPSDESIRQAVAELKARGLAVTLYPFVFMDIPPGSGLPVLDGEAEQAAYPWRGRVRGRNGTEAAADVAALFGGLQDWGLRRLALHYAALAAETGADGLLIGSEMRGLTLTRDTAGGFPAVEQLRQLAAECRAIVGPAVKLAYAADWSEYAGLRNGDEALFHLDPLWADPEIDYVGIDWYPPMGDWRDGDGGLDADAYGGPDDPAYLAAQVAGGEGFDWFYASEPDRAAQVRTPIIDGAYGEDWVFRGKDLAGWWSHAHHDRPGGVRSALPTAWVPGMKPVRLTEFGCAAVDRGANAPNLFQDPKSDEGALPPFSTGARDDRMQRRALEAVLAYFDGTQPISPVYGGPMVEAADAWCWDARPWPAFPGRADVWADAGAWRAGHWLNGRLGGETQDLIEALLRRAGLDEDEFETGPVAAAVAGYVVDRPMRGRDTLEPLLRTLGLTAAERDGRVAVISEEPPALQLSADDLALPDDQPSVRIERVLERPPAAARVRFIDGEADYRTGSASARRRGEGGVLDLDLPAVCAEGLARAAAERALDALAAETVTVRLGPLVACRLEPGDTVRLEGRDGVWRLSRLELDETPSAVLEPVLAPAAGGPDAGPRPPTPPVVVGAPFLRLIELPPLPGAEADPRPFAVMAADPWRPMTARAGPTAEALTVRGDVTEPASVGVLAAALEPGPRYRWDEVGSLLVQVEGAGPRSRPEAAVLSGANAVAVEVAGGWELLQFRTAELVGTDLWRLTGLLRGQQGTRAHGAAAGAVAVFLEPALTRVSLDPAERGLPLIWRAGPRHGGGAAAETTWTAEGVHARPWEPAHLRARPRPDGGFNLAWIPRNRLDGDRWEGGAAPADPARFRVTVLDGPVAVRRFEVEATQGVYAAADAAADLSEGTADLSFAVAQWGEGWGWGAEAMVRPG